MRFLYLHMPRFPVQRRVLEMPRLKGQPFVLVEEARGQRRVVFASSSAIRQGVTAAQTATAASALVPGIQHFSFDVESDARILAGLGEALMVVAPAFQLSPPDGIWLDASAAHLCGNEAGLIAQVLRLTQCQGYQARAVIASELFTARAVARLGREAQQIVRAGDAASSLALLPLRALELEQDDLVERLTALGLKTLGQVASLPEDAIVSRFGNAGLRLYRRARGQDEDLFVPTLVESALEESLELGFPAETMEPVLFGLKTVLDRLRARLCGRKQALVRLRLQLRLEPSGEETLTIKLARPTVQVRLVLDLARLQLEALSIPNPIARIIATVEESSPAVEQQLALGDEPEGDASLEIVLSRLASSMGAQALRSLEVLEFYRPEAASAAKAFRPPRRTSGLGTESDVPQRRAPQPHHRERPARLLPKAEALVVRFGTGGVLADAVVLGKRRSVLAMTGPEKINGTWWGSRMSPSREFFRVIFEGLGPVWLYRDLNDGRFYLAGLFD